MTTINLPDFTIIGIIFIIIAILMIFLMVKYDFFFRGTQKWFMSAALGMGVIAFSIKIFMIALFSTSEDLYQKLSLPPNKTLEGDDTSIQVANFKPAKMYYQWQALPQSAPVPLNNPLTPKKIQLGKKLFFDKRLSANGTVACSSCHELSLEKGGADEQRVSTGILQQQGFRNAPSVYNAAFQRVLFWDGRAASLEQQAS